MYRIVGGEGGSKGDYEVDVNILPDIYLEINGESGRTWHMIKLTELAKGERGGGISMKFFKYSKIPESPKSIGGHAAAVIGSKIYVSGGFRPLPGWNSGPDVTPVSNEVYYVDAHDPYPQWRLAPPMIDHRGDHYMFAYNGKLYALAGCTGRAPSVDKDGNILFGEVYDPNSTEGWKELAHLSPNVFNLQRVCGHAVVLRGSVTKILFRACMSNYLHVIPLGSNPFVFRTNYLFSHTTFASVFVDGVFYYLDYSKDIQELYAFNFDDPSSGHKRVKFVNKKRRGCLPYHCAEDPWGTVPIHPTAHLLSLGNKNLAVIWARECYRGPSLRVYCSILEVSKKEDNCFEAKVLGYSNYVLKEGSLGCCVPMLPCREDAVLRLPRSGDVVSKLPRCENVGQITETSIKQWKHLKKRTKEECVKRGNKKK